MASTVNSGMNVISDIPHDILDRHLESLASNLKKDDICPEDILETKISTYYSVGYASTLIRISVYLRTGPSFAYSFMFDSRP